MKLSEYELLVFDWDGTLSDSAGRLIAAAMKACMDVNIPQPEESFLRQHLGRTVDDIIRLGIPDLDPGDAARLVERFRYHYYANAQETLLFEGVESTLTALKSRGFMLAVATNMSRRGLSVALEHTALSSYFDATRTADESGAKPDPTMLHELMSELGVASTATLMIGDSPVDLQLAENAGVASVAIKHGGGEMEIFEPFKPIATITDLKSLLDID